MLKKTLILLTVALIAVTSCKKEDENQAPSKPKLLTPAKGAVVAPESITFTWEASTDAEGEAMEYDLAVSSDSVDWKYFSVGAASSKTIDNNSGNGSYYPFEVGKKYYWKVIVDSKDAGGQITGSAESDVVRFYTMPSGVANLSKTSGDGFVNLAWTDPAGLSKVEVTFSPAVASITQPITVNLGVGKVELTGFTNSTIYSFYVKAFNSLGHPSKADTIKALPLSPTLVHDADFNIYSTVQIGTQTWMRENLRATKWQNGQEMKNDYYRFYKVSSQSDIYGYYYYVNAAINEPLGKNPCPCGYHVPSDDEWKTLESFLGIPEVELDGMFLNRGENEGVGNLLKSTSGWMDYAIANDGNGSDLYAFKLLPAGFYDYSSFNYVGKFADVWTSTKYVEYYNFSRRLSYQNKSIRRQAFGDSGAISIRCVKD